MEQTDRLTLNTGEERRIRVATIGHAVFAATMIGLGIIGVIQGKFTPTWAGVPKSFPCARGWLISAPLFLC
jgi:hypothetical protein